ncbi:thiol-disulfide isomerase/thioredoxin [Mucilaginibacter sp. UYP25]|uniref:TlpA family protein disulfide reductase n=1 Tax=unclassified Mucilaginibacter TaxID=2617802 RepID=UPI003396B007
MKLKLCFLLFLCPIFRVTAQANPLRVGDKVPDLSLTKVLNHTGEALNLAAFKGKLLILDFWATSCGSCIEAMPRLDSLQRLFGDKIAILPVTYEKAERIRSFQNNNGFLKGRKFRTVVEDVALHNLFPHRLLPHEVWIGIDGKVLAFTEVADITAKTIAAVLSGTPLALPGKVDVLDYDQNKPLLVNHNGGPDTAYRYRSVITGVLKGLPAIVSIRYDSLKNLTIIRATNVSKRRLYTIVFKGLRALPDDQVSVGQDNMLWCYELQLPGNSPSLVRQSIRQDLDRFFNVRSEWTGTSFRLLPVMANSETDGPLTL